MSENIIYPRSPREIMDGWIHLPRYLDKIRLSLAGKLHPDYQPNLGKGFDEKWAKAAGVTHAQMAEVVKNSTTDGEVCDWVSFVSPVGLFRRLDRVRPLDHACCARLPLLSSRVSYETIRVGNHGV